VPSPGIRALVIGGTGATGKELVRELLQSPRFSGVVSLVRKQPADQPTHPKLQTVVIDMDKMEEQFQPEDTSFDVSFCCLGTTRGDAGSAEAFRKVDLGYASAFGRISQRIHVPSMHLVSSQGANANSWFLYPKTKGEAEQAYKDMGFQNLSIFRPGLLDRGDKARTIEKIALAIIPSISVKTVATAMRKLAESQYDNTLEKKGAHILTNRDIFALSQL